MAENKYLNLSGLQYYTRKLNEKKADIESPDFTGTPTISESPILTEDNSVRIIDGTKLLLEEYCTSTETNGAYTKKVYEIDDDSDAINEAFACFNNDSNVGKICESLSILWKVGSYSYLTLSSVFTNPIGTANTLRFHGINRSRNEERVELIFYRRDPSHVIHEIKVTTWTFSKNLYATLQNKADLDSPALTGTPTAPTPDATDNSTQIATTAFVRSIVPEDVAEVGIKLTNLENRLFDRILDSTELTPSSSQTSAGININRRYGSGSYYADHTLNRYQVSAGDVIKISGTAKSAKENYYIWTTMANSAFGSDRRLGPICTKDAEYIIDDTITISNDEAYLFVTASNDITVIKIGEMVEGEVTRMSSAILELENTTDHQSQFISDHFGDNARELQASYESFKFYDRCKDIIYTPITQKTKTHMVYCIPDLHKDYDCLANHLALFANSFNGNYAGATGAYGMDGMCKVIVTAGDILFNGSGVIVPRATILETLNKFITACKPFVNYNTYILPAIGGHDFNDYSSAMSNHDDKTVANNLTKRDQYDYIIAPALALVRSAITLIRPTAPSVTQNNVYAPCYYAAKDNITGSYYIMLDECDHNSTITGTYNDTTVTWTMTKINWTTNTFTAVDEATNTTYTNIPMGDFEYVYSRYKNTTYSNEQLNWVADLMENAPSGTHFWFFNHSGLRGELSDNSGARAALKDIITAYVNRTTYTASGNSTAGDLPWSVNVDFTSEDGTIVGLFRGHGHDCVEYDLGAFKEYMSDTPGNYSSTVKSQQIFADKFSGDLFVYKDSEQKLYRLHHGRRRAGIDDVPTLEEKIASLEARITSLEG